MCGQLYRASMLVLIGFGIAFFYPASAQASCEVGAVVEVAPCGWQQRETVSHHAGSATRHHVPQRAAVVRQPSCAILVEDRTPEGTFDGVVNRAQIFITGGPNDGRKSRMFSLNRGRNLLPVSCAAEKASLISVNLYGNGISCRTIVAADIESGGILNESRPIWMSRN